MNALESAGWGATTPASNVPDAEASRRISAQEFTSRRQEEYAGLGYKSSISKYITGRFEDATKTSPIKIEKKIGHAEAKHLAKEERDEKKTVGGASSFLAISPFHHAGSTRTSSGGGESSPDSLFVDEETYAIVDSGTSVTIIDLKDTTMLESFDAKKRVKIAGFNGATSRSRGSGTIVGYTVATSGEPSPFAFRTRTKSTAPLTSSCQ